MLYFSQIYLIFCRDGTAVFQSANSQSVGDEKIRSVWQIYEDTLIEIIQFHDDFEDLTTEDQNFAIEILQGIWME